MGMLIDGRWSTEDQRKTDAKGRFLRAETAFRDWVTPGGESGFAPEAGRYHLYVSLACPWAHRALILRKLKGLEDAVSLSIVDPFMGDDGWAFSEGPGCIPDPIHGAAFLREVYVAARADYTGRVSVPVLWDRERATIVNNESAEIARMFDTAFGAVARNPVSYCPESLRAQVDAVRDGIFLPINNGVYRAGFARSQEAHAEAVRELFAALDHWEGVLGRQRYLCGEVLTEADWFLFTTLIRFDAVYVTHFKCNLRRIVDYPNLSNYLRELYQVPGVAETVDLEHIKQHYYRSHESINPLRIVPEGPLLVLGAPHDRERLPARRVA